MTKLTYSGSSSCCCCCCFCVVYVWVISIDRRRGRRHRTELQYVGFSQSTQNSVWYWKKNCKRESSDGDVGCGSWLGAAVLLLFPFVHVDVLAAVGSPLAWWHYVLMSINIICYSLEESSSSWPHKDHESPRLSIIRVP